MTLDGVFHLFLCNERLQVLGCLSDIAHHVALGTEQFQFPGLRLTGLQNLLEHPYHTLDVDLHEVIVVRQLRHFLTHFVNGSRKDGEGSEQFVGDIGKHITHAKFLPEALTTHIDEPAEKGENDGKHHDGKV